MEARVTHSLVNALRSVPSLGMLDDRTLLEIVGDSANLFWSAGTQIFAKNTPADALYIVLRGSIRVLDDAGTEVAALESGAYFGEFSLLLGTEHQHDVEAVEDTELMVVPKDRFDQIVAANAELAESIRATAEERRKATAAAAAARS